jgi:hypothetical protein
VSNGDVIFFFVNDSNKINQLKKKYASLSLSLSFDTCSLKGRGVGKIMN